MWRTDMSHDPATSSLAPPRLVLLDQVISSQYLHHHGNTYSSVAWLGLLTWDIFRHVDVKFSPQGHAESPWPVVSVQHLGLHYHSHHVRYSFPPDANTCQAQKSRIETVCIRMNSCSKNRGFEYCTYFLLVQTSSENLRYQPTSVVELEFAVILLSRCSPYLVAVSLGYKDYHNSGTVYTATHLIYYIPWEW